MPTLQLYDFQFPYFFIANFANLSFNNSEPKPFDTIRIELQRSNEPPKLDYHNQTNARQ